MPVTLTDPRRWHWQSAPIVDERLSAALAAVTARSTLLAIRVQVALIYFFAFSEKLTVTEWRNGTALYYWLLYPVFGVPDYLKPLLIPVLTNPMTVTLLTWGSVGLEAVLFAGLFMDHRYRRILLPIGVLFHAGIAMFLGLFSFSVVMTAALCLYLRPVDRPFSGRLLFARRWSLRAMVPSPEKNFAAR